MKFVWVGVALLLCHGALAQDGVASSSVAEQGSAQAKATKADHVPEGGCMPIGLTARGELVFPLQCRELLDRERGPVADDQTSAGKRVVTPVAQEAPQPVIQQVAQPVMETAVQQAVQSAQPLVQPLLQQAVALPPPPNIRLRPRDSKLSAIRPYNSAINNPTIRPYKKLRPQVGIATAGNPAKPN
jgi:hypothetical protein